VRLRNTLRREQLQISGAYIALHAEIDLVGAASSFLTSKQSCAQQLVLELADIVDHTQRVAHKNTNAGGDPPIG
jgi:hypothetical protein